jgi:cytochrome c oxidase subunit 2
VAFLALVDTRKQFGDLASTYVPIAIAVFAIVAVATLVPLFLYRARRAGGPSQREEPSWVPWVYGGFLALVVAFLLTLTFRAQDKISAKVTRPGLQVNVTAAKWNWRFDYPAQHISQIGGDTAPTSLVVPSGTNVRFKRDVFPRRTTSFTLSFPGQGYHTAGRCAEYCGLKHDQMVFNVEVMSPAGFRQWVAQRQRGAGA